jgi:hypothetical protein
MSNSLMLKISAVAVAAGAAVMQISSAEAQTVAVPVSGGGFVVRYDNNESFSLSPSYVTTPTFVTPVGTIAVTGTPGFPVWQNFINIQSTDTPVGVNISGINGSVSLNDGRNATLVNNSAFLQALAKVTEGGSISTNSLNGGEAPFGTYIVEANFRSGSVNVPQSAFSPLPPPQFVIPITNGTFTLNIPANEAAFPVFTANSVITPLGTANLTFTFPASVPFEGSFIDTNNPADVSVVVNGTVVFSDGRIANIINRLVTFQTNAKVNDPNPPLTFQPNAKVVINPTIYTVADVPGVALTVLGDFSNFNISIPTSDITSPVAPAVTVAQTPIPFQLNLPSALLSNPCFVPERRLSPLSQPRFIGGDTTFNLCSCDTTLNQCL